ncbi:MAG TPA: hypothetical protein VGH19_06805 [Verrucomicrobiae bacterium]
MPISPERTEAASKFLKANGAKEISPTGLRVAVLLDDLFNGLHHFPGDIRKVEWSHEYYVAVNVQRQNFSTFDFNNLTNLVFLAHDHCIRVQISEERGPCIRFLFHPRKTREGGFSQRHPTLEQAVKEYRERFTEQHEPQTETQNHQP